MAIWAVFRNPCCFWYPFYSSWRCGGSFSKKRPCAVLECIVHLELSELNGLPDGRGLLSQANLERPMAIWTVVRNPLCCWVPFYRPRRRGGVREKEKTAVCCMGMCDLAEVERYKLPLRQPRFAWPSKPRTAHGNSGRISIPLLLLKGSVS